MTIGDTKGQKDARARKAKRRKRKSRNFGGNEKQKNSFQSKKNEEHPLKGVVLSISTLNDKTSEQDGGGELTYSSVTQMCRELGAEVLGQVGKRVRYVVCSQAAVEQATQRVRKARKKRIPIVNIEWLEKCKVEKKLLSVTEYLMDEKAEAVIQARRKKPDDNTAKEGEHAAEEIPPDDAGWTDAVSLGCCCICHENGTEKDCQWCKDLPCGKKWSLRRQKNDAM